MSRQTELMESWREMAKLAERQRRGMRTGHFEESAKSLRSRCWLCGNYGKDRYPHGDGRVMMWQGARHVMKNGRTFDCEPCGVRWTQLDDGEVFHEKRLSLLNYRGAHP